MITNHERFDTTIIGAGPAGCSAAITLARLGMNVGLVEAGEVGREKLCGEFLSPECNDLLTQLGLRDRVNSLCPVDIHTARLTAPDGAVCEIALPDTGLGLSRSALDAALWEAAMTAGANGYEKTDVLKVVGDLQRGFELETTRGACSSRSVIAAHGRRARLDRTLDRSFLNLPQPFVGLKAHFLGPALRHRIELHFFAGGYCGLAEIEGGRVNVCLLVRTPTFRAAVGSSREPMDAFVHWMQVQNVELRKWLASAQMVDSHWLSVAEIPFTSKRTVERDILMAGDAAGLVVPLAGDGIAMALQCGMMAAEQCASFLKGECSARELTDGYSISWERTFGERIRLGRILQRLVLQPRLAGLALRTLNRVPALSGYLFRHTRAQSAHTYSEQSR